MTTYTNVFSHRQLMLTDPRTEIGSGDTISVAASSDTITTNGLVLAPASITFTATTTGIFANIPPANIVWKKNDDGDPLGTGTQIQILNSQYGIDALANAGSYSITATATLNPAADQPIFKKATKVVTLSSNNISANISPATASYTTDAAGVGTASIVLTMNIVAGTTSVADNWTYAWQGATFAGNATTANTASVTVISISTDTATVQCIATKGIYTITKTAVISKSKTGISGPGTKLIYAKFQTAPTEPPYPSTTTDPQIPDGWSTSVAGAPGTGLIYVCTGNKPAGNAQWTWNVPILMQGQTGSAAKMVEVNGTDIVFVRAKNSGTPTPGQITLSATCKNFTPNNLTNAFVWTKSTNGGSPVPYTTYYSASDYSQIIVQPAANIGNDTYKVVVNADPTLSDSVTVPTLREGDDSLNALLTNENQTIAVNSAGTIIPAEGILITSQMYSSRYTRLPDQFQRKIKQPAG